MLYNLWHNGINVGAVNPQDVDLIKLKTLYPDDNFIILEDGQSPDDFDFSKTSEPNHLELPFAVGDDFTDSIKVSLAEHTLTTQDLLLEELQKAREENLRLQTEVLDLRAQLFNKEL